VFYANEKAERCKVPCSFKVAKASGSQSITVRATGFLDEKHAVSLASSDNIDVAMKKKAGGGGTGGHGGSGTGGHGGSGTGGHGSGHGSGGPGDNTINPFDN